MKFAISWAVLILMVGCSKSKPVITRSFFVIVHNDSNEVIPNATGIFQNGGAAVQCNTVNGQLTCIHTATGSGILIISAPGYENLDVMILDATVLEQGEAQLKTIKKFLPRLVQSNHYFKKENSERITLIGATDFRIIQICLDKNYALLNQILEDRKGFNILRAFSMAQNLFVFHPQDYPNYYNDLPNCVQRLANKDFYLEFTVFADAPLVMPNADEQIKHWNKIIEVLKDSSNVIFELGNELDQTPNRLDTRLFAQPSLPIISSRGSNGSQSIPPRPAWAYETFHTNDANEWWRKVGHNTWELSNDSHVPGWANENTRFPDRDNNLMHAYDAAAGAVLLTGGSLFHSVNGRLSNLFDSGEKLAKEQWINGANSVPLECQDGDYNHGTAMINIEKTEGLLRAYQRGTSPNCIVKIRH